MRHRIVLPELGLSHWVVSLWLVDKGRNVTAGDRVIEVLADGVTVDLPAPATGVLVEQLVGDDDPLVVGQVLGWIEGEGGS